MALNASGQAAADHRRRMVASFRLRGLTQREIVEALVGEGCLNPKTGEAWSLGIVNRDLQALSDAWKREAAGQTAELKARNLAELRELRRMAWEDKKHYAILQGLKQEAELLGLEKGAVDEIGKLAETFLAGADTVRKMEVPDLSEG